MEGDGGAGDGVGSGVWRRGTFVLEAGKISEGGGEEEAWGGGVARTGIAVGEVDGIGAGEMRLLSIFFSPSWAFLPSAAE